MQLSHGIPSLSVTLCESVSIPATMPVYKLNGVSTLYNVEFEKKGMRVWKAYDLGPGRLRTEECFSNDMPYMLSLFRRTQINFLTLKNEYQHDE